MHFDFMKAYERQIVWSKKTFGPGRGTTGVIDHIREELIECEDAPEDLEEWADVLILALDGAWRCIATKNPKAKPEDMVHAIMSMYKFKTDKNRKRQWPDWRTAEPGKAIGHIE